MKRNMRSIFIFALAAGLASSVHATTFTSVERAGGPVVAQEWIVQFDSNYSPYVAALDAAWTFEGYVEKSWETAINGALITGMTEEQAAAMATMPHVVSVEPNIRMSIGVDQSDATWGLDRIDQRSGSLNNTYSYGFTGTGVHAYIIDTGIRGSHAEFSGRMGGGYNALGSPTDTEDCNGHGTHVAGTVGGTTYGVAKNVTLHPIRVLDCRGSGTLAGVIEGVNWVSENAIEPAVANMSLGGGVSASLDQAVDNSVAKGIFYAVAAGNNNGNACNNSPARATGAFTVGSTTQSDTRSSFSNYGSCVDIFAPGSGITAAWHTGDTSTNTISGTSMASPHVAGAAALLYDENPNLTVQDVKSTLTRIATPNAISNPGSGSPNLLLFTLNSEPPACTPDETPETSCADGIDNDCDGWVDAADPDCQSEPPPPECSPSGDSCRGDTDCCSGDCRTFFFWRFCG